MRRRVAAGGLGLLALILLVFGLNSCLDNRSERAFVDYVREASGFVEESDQQSKALFALLRGKRKQTPVEVRNTVNGFRDEAAQLVDRAKENDRPDELADAQRHLVQTLELRRDGIGGIAERLPRALGDEGREEATQAIAAQMQFLLSSDVIYSQRFIPVTERALKDKGLLDQVEPARSQFLPDIDWLRPKTVAARIAELTGGEGAAVAEEAATPGLHGTGLGAVRIQPSGTALAAGGQAQIKLSDDLAFEVEVMNQGENPERKVPVTVTISGGSGKPIVIEDQLAAVAAGKSGTVTIPLATAPPTGRPLEIDVAIEAVPGEEKTDNNGGKFRATFTR